MRKSIGVVITMVGLLIPMAGGQAPQAPFLDGALIVAGNNSKTMVQLLDANGDGNMDVLRIRQDGLYISMDVVNIQGSGGLMMSHYMSIPLPAFPLTDPATAVGRLGSDDGRDDVVVCLAGTVVVQQLLGIGTAATTHTHTIQLGSNILGAAISDFTGDGLGDIALLTDTSVEIHAFVNPTTYTVLSLPLPASSTRRLVTGELTGDSVPDLAMVDSNASIFTAVGGTLSLVATMNHGVSNIHPTVGDIDNDGDDDIVIFGDVAYEVLRRTGPLGYVLESPVVGGPATHLIDLDGDGDLDGACCGGGGGGPPLILSTPSTFHVARNDGGVFQSAFEIPGMGAYHLAGAHDMNNDGFMDLVAGRCIYYARQPLTVDPFLPGSAQASVENVLDVEGDGDVDWAVGLDSTCWNRGDGVASVASLSMLTPPALGQTYAGPGYPGDFDGDGDADLVIECNTLGVLAVHLLVNRGGVFEDMGAAFPPGVAITPYTSPDSFFGLARDVDADGDEDLIIRSSDPAVRWSHLWANNGVGAFSLMTVVSGKTVVDVADFTNDGIPDLLVSDGRLLLQQGLGAGGFAPAVGLTSVSYPYFNASATFAPTTDNVAIADFDQDGDLDIVASERVSGASFPTFLRNNMVENGNAIPMTPLGAPGGLNGISGAFPTRMFVADVDLDGHLDCMIRNSHHAFTNGLGIAFGAGGSGPISSIFDASRTAAVLIPAEAAADVDGDGDVDLIGAKVYRNFTKVQVGGPRRLQFGLGLAGSLGIVPRLGAQGSVSVGATINVILRGGLGGRASVLAVGTQLASTPLVGGTAYLVPDFYMPLALSGPIGVAGEGSWDLPIGPLPASLVGTSVYLQAGVDDPQAPMGIALTNGLELNIGT